MDRLRVAILIAQARVEREILRQRVARLERRMFPMADDKPPRDLRSLAKAVGQFRSDLDGEAAKVFDAMEAARVRSADVFRKTRSTVMAHLSSIDEIDKLVTDLDRANGPSSDDSSKGSTGSSDATKEPSASWAGGNK